MREQFDEDRAAAALPTGFTSAAYFGGSWGWRPARTVQKSILKVISSAECRLLRVEDGVSNVE
jgi:hypothetical protein